MSDNEVDLFVIGGGSGGVRAARIAAGYGAKVMLAEEYRMGGTCVIRGCVPKKLYVYASRFADDFEDAAGFGWSLPQSPEFDWQKLVAAKEQEITRLEGHYLRGQTSAGVEVVKSRAVLEDAHTVRLLADNRLIRARHILIATGGRVAMPPIKGAELAISSAEVFDLKEFPKRIIIAGGGFIAVEFAGIFKGLGAEVTLVHRGDNILRGFDEDLRETLRTAYEARGIRVLLNTNFTSIEKIEGGLRVLTDQGETLEADQVMLALGRVPNTEGLGLEKAGVKLKHNHHAIEVDAASRTSVPHIYAVGDVTDRINLTPVAIREGHAVADSVFGGKPWTVDHTNVAKAVFSTPELGSVGLTEAEARASFDIVDIYKTSFRTTKATLSGSAARVMMKLVVDGKTERVLGCHIAGEGAGEMIQLVAIAVKMGATKTDFDQTVAVHPTAAEELVTMRSRTARYERAAS